MKLLIPAIMAGNTYGYWLMGANNILTTQRLDPIVRPGRVGTHVHSVIGGSNFGFELTTDFLRESECTSIPIAEDKSNYWYPHLYFWWKNGSFTSVDGSPVIVSFGSYYLYSDEPGATTAFPDNFRMMSGDPTLRTLNASSFAQQAVTFLCLNFEGESVRYNELPDHRCPNGIRAEINFPSCWDGENIDSEDHKSHVAFLSTGPDNGTCLDPAYPVTLPRIFLEVYWYTQGFDDVRHEAMNFKQPFVFSNGDPTGYSYHSDFFNGWEPGVLQRALDECNCNPFGDPACCVERGIFSFDNSRRCYITEAIFEPTLGTLDSLPGNNPVQEECYDEYPDTVIPPIMAPVYVHNGSNLAPSDTSTTLVPARTLVTKERPRGTCIAGSSSLRQTTTKTLLSLIPSFWAIRLAFSLI
ncbi:hypothetical protein CC1G_01640 [Coprinopsis cinerea okayama7|uniref:DUF1996 domain-containing protein n=1 Tax=Coprinopsis cinerea (strain Okayama-7 / 130 / ATCC MYA-4618 / FGSC 9003) TaxID=240176 RepID=A8NIC1_COPC7|nr:hypothetical protein CC1G_01640 [Coprinopsis cinerea okayama7\|eukprot:XP_001833963.2 hypothetical protein CC1G_01640 [Coprinopsis cinerea okayama7\